MKYCAALVLLSLIATGLRADDTDLEVDYLLSEIRSSGCSFVRNGEMHDAANAADHLAMKYRRGRRYVDSAEQFIDRIATQSSWTGEIYRVRCDGQDTPSGTWLAAALDGYRKAEG